MPAGGDSFLQICLWRQGFAVTDPGPGLTMPDVQMFDPGTEDRKGLMHRWISALEGECDEVCQVGLCNQHYATKPLECPQSQGGPCSKGSSQQGQRNNARQASQLGGGTCWTYACYTGRPQDSQGNTSWPCGSRVR